VHRSALLPSNEVELLEALAGRDLDEVEIDRWAVFVRSAGRAWMFFPVEVAYEEGDPIRDVDRIAIKEAEPSRSAKEGVARDLGNIQRICIARSLRAYFPGQRTAGTELVLGGKAVRIPPGVGHRSVQFAPQRLAEALASRPELRDLHFMSVDLGLVIETDQHRVLIRTSGYSAEQFIDPAPQSEHLADCDLLPLRSPLS